VILMFSILEICAFISYIYFKTIVIDNLYLFRKWRGSSPAHGTSQFQHSSRFNQLLRQKYPVTSIRIRRNSSMINIKEFEVKRLGVISIF